VNKVVGNQPFDFFFVQQKDNLRLQASSEKSPDSQSRTTRLRRIFFFKLSPCWPPTRHFNPPFVRHSQAFFYQRGEFQGIRSVNISWGCQRSFALGPFY
jgi:hypothetical protein